MINISLEHMIFTARIRRMGKVMFSQVSVHSHGGITPCPRFFPRSLVPGPFLAGGRYPSPRFFPRYLVPGPFPGYHCPWFFPRSLVPGPFSGLPQSWPGGTPVLVRKYPNPGWGYPGPSPSWGVLAAGTPVLARGTPSQEGYPSPVLARTHQDKTRLHCLLGQDKTWVPPPPPRQNSRASTCCTAGGMPLAVMEQDFLVEYKIVETMFVLM